MGFEARGICELEAGLVCIGKPCLKRRRKRKKRKKRKGEGEGRETAISERMREVAEKISLKRNN